MLEVRDLNAFYGDAQALWNVTMHIDAGEIVSLIGPNGAGKSTILSSIAGLHPALRGQITIDGTNILGLPAHRVNARGIAIVPEGRRIFSHMSVHDNLCLGAYRRTARATYRQTITTVYHLFPRLRARSTHPAGHLSGGEQQMLAIGRALMATPRLLLLDEPSLGLAPVIVDEVYDALTTINTPTTPNHAASILLVDQDITRALALSTRGYLLTEGRITATGTSTQLRNSEQVRHSILN